MQITANNNLRIILDNVGVILSSLCLFHCILLPFVISFLPLMGFSFLENELIHKILAVSTCVIAIFAFIPGFKLHRKKSVLFAAIVGLFFILSAVLYVGDAWGESAEKWFTLLGGCGLIVAHIANKTFCKECLKCNQDDKDECGVLS